MTPERFNQLRFKHKSGASWVRNLTAEINECLNEIERQRTVIEAAKTLLSRDKGDGGSRLVLEVDLIALESTVKDLDQK